METSVRRRAFIIIRKNNKRAGRSGAPVPFYFDVMGHIENLEGLAWGIIERRIRTQNAGDTYTKMILREREQLVEDTLLGLTFGRLLEVPAGVEERLNARTKAFDMAGYLVHQSIAVRDRIRALRSSRLAKQGRTHKG